MSAAFVDLKKTNVTDTLWMIAATRGVRSARPMGIAGAVYGSPNVTKSLNLDLRICFNTADEAKNLASMARASSRPRRGCSTRSPSPPTPRT
jgi:hypothetical protein